jgi:HAD superfamily hydrolase (TIGR01509 family)
MISVVIFDMDGLMFDTERVATRAWKQTFRDLGYELTDDLNLAMVGRNEPDSNAIIAEAMGPRFPVVQCRREANDRYIRLLESEGIPLKPGLNNLLDFLKTSAIPSAVATSTQRYLAMRKLSLAGLISRFSAIVAGDDVQKGKPEPDLFLEAARLLNSAPERCVVLEDSPAGIRAANAAGMIPVMVPDLIQPDETIRSLAYAIVPTLVKAHETIIDLISHR